jgi:hypothetical protein
VRPNRTLCCRPRGGAGAVAVPCVLRAAMLAAVPVGSKCMVYADSYSLKWRRLRCLRVCTLPQCQTQTPYAVHSSCGRSSGSSLRSPYFKRLWRPGIDFDGPNPPAYVALRAGTTNVVVEQARYAGYRFLGSLKGLQIRALLAVLRLG